MDYVNTWYGDISQPLFDRFSDIKLVVFDVDGVFSDGRIYLGNHGEELKAFHTRDGFGVKALADAGFSLAVITGRQSQIVEQRMQHLSVEHIFQGVNNKQKVFVELLEQLQLTFQQVAYVGDDIPDLALIEQVGVGIAVQDAHPLVQQRADYVTRCLGGHGAVREVSDLLLMAHGKLHDVSGASI
ncbi:3-deoxy-manno-octulosonate-8-phosphatase KdsC [Idiomarina tyrosinivorans]|uniref:3-deoxy-D-manno-octulosonate 8-phosphate phosphatase KdsC n=1 Tax=Idiomarina tyrosinivorans TaxID=1445662 RepID=A0A432ZQD1_9GAMM|nr:3-deoxy-manno-octulosonate-8-phosphatase KdsC [Idiomarina tyrosinivorans]RUO80114.1 3-deoxy-manno-octulosonate-8-phosphatase KdsC [Idiomarina tyrosinivorans]